jgi:hypothetical protein
MPVYVAVPKPAVALSPPIILENAFANVSPIGYIKL